MALAACVSVNFSHTILFLSICCFRLVGGTFFFVVFIFFYLAPSSFIFLLLEIIESMQIQFCLHTVYTLALISPVTLTASIKPQECGKVEVCSSFTLHVPHAPIDAAE